MADSAHYARLIRNLESYGSMSGVQRHKKNITIRRQSAQLRAREEEIARLTKTIKKLKLDHRTEIDAMSQRHRDKIRTLHAEHMHSIETAKKRDEMTRKLKRASRRHRRNIGLEGGTRRRRRRRSRC